MTLTFRYKSVKRPDGTEVKTPSIPLILKWKEQIETTALLDSGADVSAMPEAIAKILSCELSKDIKPAYGLGGKVDSVQTNVEAILEKGHEKYNLIIPVKIILGRYDFPILLGRQGFFENFVITIDQLHEKISLKRVSRKY